MIKCYKEGITHLWMKSLGDILQKSVGVCSREITNAAAQKQQGNWILALIQTVEPAKSIFVEAPQALARDVLVGWQVCQTPYQFCMIKIQRKVVYSLLTGPIERAKEEIHLAKIAGQWQTKLSLEV